MSEPSNIDKLIQAYNRMMERVKAGLDDTNLQRSIEHAAEKAVELGELTREEAHMVGGYLKRDLEDAGHYLATTGHDLGAWLRFDLELAEDRLLALFKAAADKSRLEMLAFEEILERASHYHTGEITGPGTLQCDGCGKRLQFHAIGHIPPCPRCHHSRFSRVDTDSPSDQ